MLRLFVFMAYTYSKPSNYQIQVNHDWPTTHRLTSASVRFTSVSMGGSLRSLNLHVWYDDMSAPDGGTGGTSTTILGKRNGSTGSTVTNYTFDLSSAALAKINAKIADGTFRGFWVGYGSNNTTDYSGNVSDYTLDAALSVLSPKNAAVLETPVEFDAEPAMASAMAGNALFSYDAGHTAVPAGATAAMGNHSVTTQTIITVRSLSPQVLSRNRVAQTGSTFSMVANAPVYIQVPAVPDAARYDAKGLKLNLRVTSAGSVSGVARAGTWSGTTWVPGASLWTGNLGTHVNFDVPLGTQWIALDFSTFDISENIYDNPATGTVEGLVSHFAYTLEVLPSVGGDADVIDVDAEMVHPSTASSSLALAEAMNADAYMERVWFPDFTWLATPAGASAEMRSSWFRSDNAELVEPAEALAEAIDGAAVATDRNIEVIARTADARGRVMDPEEVNDLTADPYWNRVTGRSTQGSMPARTGATWLRLNERSGTSVVPSDAISGQKVPAGALTIVGDYTWGSDGPGGRRALEVRNAGIDDVRGGGFQQTLALQGASFEFAVRIQPGHTGRMDIANGHQDYSYDASSIGPKAKLHVSIRDGRLYASTHYGGTSVKRIDDGEWHHIVITRSEHMHPNVVGYSEWDDRHGLELWIDGMLDRSLVSEENRQSGSRERNPGLMARPSHYFGQDTGYPFRGDIAEIVYRPHFLTGNNVTDLYLDLFGYTPVRPGVVGSALADMTPDNKVESNMKRMLVLFWGNPPYVGGGEDWNNRGDMKVAGHTAANWHPRSPNVMPRSKPSLTPMLGYGYDEEMDIGRYLIQHQSIESLGFTMYDEYDRSVMHRESHVKPSVLEQQVSRGDGSIRRFRDLNTGKQRFINLQEDIDLSAYDVITFQGYPNPVYKDQDERLRYEAFFESVNTALADGAKILMTDAFLAADLGWVSKVDEVPVLGDVLNGRIIKSNAVGGNDVRSYEIAPWIGLHGQTMEKPADGSMPKLQEELVNGSNYPKENIWSWDLHKNNGFRVVAEVEGLTDLPSWEVEEAFYRNRLDMLPKNGQWDQRGYKVANLTGKDYEWERFYEKVDNVGRPTGEPRDDLPTFKFVDPSIQRGLKAGDEFYDWTWIDSGFDYYYFRGTARNDVAEWAKNRRILSTWAIPPGGLRIGTPLSTFRTHVWNDFGNEVLNPYRNHIRNAVVRAGDRLPDGRKVSGYAYLEFAEMPRPDLAAGIGIARDQPFGPGMHPDKRYRGTDVTGWSGSDTNLGELKVEDEYSFGWDWMTPGRTDYSGGGRTPDKVIFTFGWDRDKTGELIPTWASQNEGGGIGSKTIAGLPIAQQQKPTHPQDVLPHMTWLARGLAWLTLVNTEDAEVALTQADVATSTAQMVMPQVETDFDLVVTAGVAQASARIVDPEETAVKSTSVMAFAATASGRMLGLQGGYKAEAATSFADMLQNVLRPLDIEEVLFFTLTFNQKPIYLRMEEN